MRIKIRHNSQNLLGIDGVYFYEQLMESIQNYPTWIATWIDNLDQADGILELMALVVNGRINNWKNIHLRE